MTSSRPSVLDRWAEAVQDHPVVWAFGVLSGFTVGFLTGVLL